MSLLSATSPLRSLNKLNLVFWQDGSWGLNLPFPPAVCFADEGGKYGLGVSRQCGHPLEGDRYSSLEGDGLTRLEALVTTMVGFFTNRKDGNIVYNENEHGKDTWQYGQLQLIVNNDIRICQHFFGESRQLWIVNNANKKYKKVANTRLYYDEGTKYKIVDNKVLRYWQLSFICTTMPQRQLSWVNNNVDNK